VIALVQRVSEASVVVGGNTVSAIGAGLLAFVCAEPDDTVAHADRLAIKLLNLRIFSDDAGKMNRSVQDVGGALLIVSQFTLGADTSGGHRPSFSGAAAPELGRLLYERVIATARERHRDVATGEFGAHMRVRLINDGPVTIPITVRG